MDNTKLQLISDLYDLGNLALKIAKSLESYTETVLAPTSKIAISSEVSLDITEFERWPVAGYSDPTLMDLNGYSKVLEIGTAPYYQPLNITCDTKAVLTTQFLPGNIKLLTALDTDVYDLIIINQTMEFTKTPLELLKSIKNNLNKKSKVWIKFRPWTSIDGGFQSVYFNRAFAHLACDLQHNDEILFKSIRPIATYESLLKSAGLVILSREITSSQLPPMLHTGSEVLQAICKRTWGTIREQDALQILKTQSIEYLVSI